MELLVMISIILLGFLIHRQELILEKLTGIQQDKTLIQTRTGQTIKLLDSDFIRDAEKDDQGIAGQLVVDCSWEGGFFKIRTHINNYYDVYQPISINEQILVWNAN